MTLFSRLFVQRAFLQLPLLFMPMLMLFMSMLMSFFNIMVPTTCHEPTPFCHKYLFASALAPETDCSLFDGMQRETCLEKIDEGCELTWVGPGCGSGDGGCKPQGWCGFTCHRRCTSFERCMWEAGFGCKQRPTESTAPTPQPPTVAPTPQPPSTAPTPQPPTVAPSPTCSLFDGMTRRTCKEKINAGCRLTWVGPGCGDGDGGCKPERWCGFTCRDRCKHFDRCVWEDGYGCKRGAAVFMASTIYPTSHPIPSEATEDTATGLEPKSESASDSDSDSASSKGGSEFADISAVILGAVSGAAFLVIGSTVGVAFLRSYRAGTSRTLQCRGAPQTSEDGQVHTIANGASTKIYY